MQIKSVHNKNCDIVKKRRASFSSSNGQKQSQGLLKKYSALRKRIAKFAKRIVMPEKLKSKTEEFKRPLCKPHFRKRIASLNKDDVELGPYLGSGGFGAVYVGKYKNTKVAVKVLHKVSKNPAAQLESFKAELNTIGFQHRNIVRTITATSLDCFDQGAWIVMEYAGDRTLQSLIDDETVSFGPMKRLRYTLQIASALKYAHGNKICHLDLKPANVLISLNGKSCKLADFGCSQKVEIDTGIVSPTQRSLLTGTFAYRAPELLKGEAPSMRADVYSLAVTMWQMLARSTPYGNENQHVVIFGVVSYGHRPKHPEIELDPFEESYRDLYSQCWSASSLDRPTSGELVDLLKLWKSYM